MDNVFKYPPKYGEYGLTEGNTQIVKTYFDTLTLGGPTFYQIGYIDDGEEITVPTLGKTWLDSFEPLATNFFIIKNIKAEPDSDIRRDFWLQIPDTEMITEDEKNLLEASRFSVDEGAEKCCFNDEDFSGEDASYKMWGNFITVSKAVAYRIIDYKITDGIQKGINYM